jgi:hypothetical protein
MIFWEVQKSIDSKNLHLRMGKIILLLFVCISSNLIAQKSFFGVDAGLDVANQRVHVNYYNYSYTSSSSQPTPAQPISTFFFQNLLRPTYSVFFQKNFNEKMGVRVKAQYLALGYRNAGSDPDRVEINYLSFPVTFNYSIKNFHLNTGVYLTFTLNGTRINGQEITKTYHKNDNGLLFGVEYDVYKNFAIATSYIFGLKNIWLNDKIGQPYLGIIGTTHYTNRALQFTLIYKFKKPLSIT